MAAGDEEANDAHTRRDDPIFTLLRERLPETGASLASQPTLSRFAHRVSRPELYRMALELVPQFIAAYATPPTGIVLAVDDTEDPVHGGQEHARYDGYYGGDCFMPRHVYAGLSGRLITPLLKVKRFPGAQRLAGLKRLVKRLRQLWPHPLLLGRGERPFAAPEVMPWIEAHPDMGYVTGLTRKAVLQALAREVGEQATRAYALSGHTVTRFHSTRYQAGPGACPRRVVIKVEVSEQGINTRFVVTDLEPARTKVLDQNIYCARGQAENDINDHKLYLKSERPSCHRFAANQVRVLLPAAAYVFLETLRRAVLPPPMGLGAHGNPPAPRAQTRCPGARGRGADHDFLPLLVSGGANIEAQFDLIGVCASDCGEPVRRREERRGLKDEEFAVGPRGLPGGRVPDSDHDPALYRPRTA